MHLRPAILLVMTACLLLPARSVSAREGTLRFDLSYAAAPTGLKKALRPAERQGPRLGLALAGGGAKAAASLGVLKVLAEEGIPVSAIAGTSMGALVGGLTAAGYRPAEIETVFLKNDWNDIFRDTPARAFLTSEQKRAGGRHLLEFYFRGGRFIVPSGLTAGQKLANLLTENTLAASFQAGLDFDNLPVPFRAVAADIETGREVVISRGLLHDALRASAAVPFVFQPVELQGRLLVDGGLANNLPVEVVRTMGVDIVIAVDASSKPGPRDKLTNLFAVMSQAITLTVQQESRLQAALADLVIRPDTGAYSFADFPRMDEIIAVGEAAARAALPEIRTLLARKKPPAAQRHYRIVDMAVAGNRQAPDAMILRQLRTSLPDREATRDDLVTAMADLFDLGLFSHVFVELRPSGAGYLALFTMAEHPVVRAVEVSGNRLIPSREILAAAADQTGRTLNTAALAAGLDRLVDSYRRRGYRLVRLESAAMDANGTLRIVMDEGRVNAIRLTGQKRTKQSLLEREIDTDRGQPLNFAVLSRDIQNFYGLGYFESLYVDIAKSGEGGVDLSFRVKEKPTGSVRLGLRYDLEDSFTGLTDINVDNAGGRGIKLFLTARYGTYADLALGYHSPVFLRSHFFHAFQSFYSRRDYALYVDKNKTGELEVTRAGGELSLGYQWSKYGDTALRYRYSADRTVEGLGPASTQTMEPIGSLAFLASLDTRDSSAFPHRGMLLAGSYESAAAAYGSDLEFRKTSLGAQAALPLGDHHTFILDAALGLGSGALPYHEQFGIGGADFLLAFPLLGYERREFVGANLLGISAGYRWKIADYQLKAVRAVYLGLTGQAANVWDSRDAIAVKDLRKGGGLGVYADTLIGPFRLDLGAGEDDRFRVYFSAGFEF